MMKIEVIRKGVDPANIQQLINVQFMKFGEALEFLAKETRDHMRQTIKARTYRQPSTGNLAASINYYPLKGLLKGAIGYGVGDVQELNYMAPYWYLMNYGGFGTYAARQQTMYGNFNGQPPDSRLAGTNPGGGPDKFYKNTQPLYPMKPMNPVGAKNYIEETANWSASIYRIHFSGSLGKTQLFQKA